MFTGIVGCQGKVLDRKGLRLALQTPSLGLRVGDSVAVNGVCLTVVRAVRIPGGQRVEFDLSEETLRRTTLGEWGPGRSVNLERALRMGDPLGGHMVQGHVDAVGRLISRRSKDGWSLFTFSFPAELRDYLVHKGSVAVDGISLTLLEPARGRFGVAVIPHTERVTTLGATRAGDAVNLETDPLAKHVVTLMKNWRRS